MTKPRRAAGTRYFTDVLLSLVFLRHRTPKKDASSLLNGQPLVVATIRHTPTKWERGHLDLVLGDHPMFDWTSRTGEAIRLSPPIEIDDVRKLRRDERIPAPGYKFALVEFRDARDRWRSAIPTVDVPLVQRAFEEATKRRSEM